MSFQIFYWFVMQVYATLLSIIFEAYDTDVESVGSFVIYTFVIKARYRYFTPHRE